MDQSNWTGGCYDTAGSKKLKLGKNFKKIYPLYEYFAREWKDCLDFSEEALFVLYENETFGTGDVKANNGYAHGKKWMGVAVSQWREDMYRTLWPFELYNDPNLPDWWLDKVLPEFAEWRKFGSCNNES